MKLYKNYCYETIEDVSDVILSDPFVREKSHIVNVTNTPSVITVKFNKKPIFVDITPPDCTKLGFNSSYTGLTMSDSIELSGMISLALLSVWGIKILRRGL